ncbi:alpha/beta hydrolase family protein [Flavisphingomonas formosensis]|uniref:alpha/beta hydrolase family protein n=1 Tax=Flavisphingomonas formosensis TaxID=861534 RepID=UPI001E48F4A4|nr:S9 family peptidase [Sphingomonas formosensis]
MRIGTVKRRLRGNCGWMGLLAASVLFAGAIPAEAADAPVDPARLFGVRPDIEDISLSPDGSKVALIMPGPGRASILSVAKVGVGQAPKGLNRTDGNPTRLVSCNWVADDRLVCMTYGLVHFQGDMIGFTRLSAVDTNTGAARELGTRDNDKTLGLHQFDGEIIDRLDQREWVLLSRSYVPQVDIGTRLAQTRSGLGVDKVNVRTLAVQNVEVARENAARYMSDGNGHVRIMQMEMTAGPQQSLTGVTVTYYRSSQGDGWKELARNDPKTDQSFTPLGVDGGQNAVYVLKKKDGRNALYKILLDGSMQTDLVYANPQVDVDDIVTLGRDGHVIGVSYVTDRREVAYLDPDYEKLARSLSKALPGLPLVRFIDASRDLSKLLIFAGSDIDPGRYYVLDRSTHQMKEISLARPDLEHVRLAEQKAVTYSSIDGVRVPAYLTLPPGSNGKNLPALVMPHGGPSARDEWGFDWLAQYFAHRGFAVLQPNFRGSSGYGADWFVDNGFRSWRTAIGDVVGAGRWLIKEGIADPAKLGIFGWSYGGYAALQSNVLDSDLFKAVIAVAPVTDLQSLKQEAQNFTNDRLVRAFVGDGPAVTDGSPVRHAAAFKAPVLMFHGDQDGNVRIFQSREMDDALRHAGKSSELVVFKGLDHQLDDSDARTQLLARSYDFLKANLHM